MRSFRLCLAVVVLAGCATQPHHGSESNPDPHTSLLQARSRVTQLEQENARLQQEIDRLARELGEVSAELKTARAQAAPTTTTSPVRSSDNWPYVPAYVDPATVDPFRTTPTDGSTNPPPAETPARPTESGTRSIGSGTVYTGPRGGRYTITPSGNKRYLPRSR
jgi:hypothetical protein